LPQFWQIKKVFEGLSNILYEFIQKKFLTFEKNSSTEKPKTC
jgi:hypothetical protein